MRAGGGRTPPRQLGGSGERRLPFLVCRYVSGTPSIYVSFLFYVFIGFNYFFLFNSIRRPPPRFCKTMRKAPGCAAGHKAGGQRGPASPGETLPPCAGGLEGPSGSGEGGGSPYHDTTTTPPPAATVSPCPPPPRPRPVPTPAVSAVPLCAAHPFPTQP